MNNLKDEKDLVEVTWNWPLKGPSLAAVLITLMLCITALLIVDKLIV